MSAQRDDLEAALQRAAELERESRAQRGARCLAYAG
jgi:hypothetical protein